MKGLFAGIAVADLIGTGLDRVAEPGEVVFPKSIELRVGGHPCNVSIDLVDLSVEPEDLVVSVSLGDDLLGNFVEETLMGRGVSLRVKRSERETSADLILVEEGKDRRYHPTVGANRDLTADFVEEVLKKESPDLFYVGGVGMLGLDTNLDEILEIAKGENVLTFVDPVEPHAHNWSYLADALDKLDVLHLNDEEGEALTGKKSAEAIMESLLNEGTKLVLLTRGEEGATAASTDFRVQVPAFSPAPYGEIRDPTGAGDAFCAGAIKKIFEAGGVDGFLKSKEELADLLKYASGCGALACTLPGTTGALRPDQVRRIIERK